MAETNNIVVVLKLKINKVGRGGGSLQQRFSGGPVVGKCLSMWGTQARSQDREDSTCLGVVKPVGHKPMCLEQVLHN